MKYHEYVLFFSYGELSESRRSMIGNHVGGKHCLKGSNPLLRFIFTNPTLVKRLRHRPFHGGNTGSSPVRVIYFNSNIPFGGLAQLGEHLPYKQGSAVRSVNLHYSVGSVV